MEEPQSTQDVVKAALRALATELRIRTARPLLAAARGKVPGATLALATAVRKGQTSTQTFAPAPRSRGKSSAEDVGVVFQADLIDLTNARSSTDKRFALVVLDSFSREIGTKAIANKKASTVNEAFKTLVQTPTAGESIKVTTDKGKEFTDLD